MIDRKSNRNTLPSVIEMAQRRDTHQQILLEQFDAFCEDLVAELEHWRQGLAKASVVPAPEKTAAQEGVALSLSLPTGFSYDIIISRAVFPLAPHGPDAARVFVYFSDLPAQPILSVDFFGSPENYRWQVVNARSGKTIFSAAVDPAISSGQLSAAQVVIDSLLSLVRVWKPQPSRESLGTLMMTEPVFPTGSE